MQIDSLADVISFGVAPSLIVYQWTSAEHPIAALVIAFLFTGCGAVRLARFNVLSTHVSGSPTKPGKYIVGLPIPGAAGILISLIVANHAIDGRLSAEVGTWPVLGATLLLSMLMVSTVRFRSFKDLKLNARTIGVVAFAMGSSALIYTRLQPAFVLVWLLGFYVMLGLFEALWRSRATNRPPRDSIPPRAFDENRSVRQGSRPGLRCGSSYLSSLPRSTWGYSSPIGAFCRGCATRLQPLS